MPENDWDCILGSVTEEVLEAMFFTSVYGPADASPPDGEPHVSAHLTFRGSPCGAMTLSLTEPAARTLAASFLAAEPDEPLASSQLGGVVCELTNMICGSLLSRVESQTHFQLSSPELLPDGAALPACPPNQSLDLGDGMLALWLTLENHAG